MYAGDSRSLKQKDQDQEFKVILYYIIEFGASPGHTRPFVKKKKGWGGSVNSWVFRILWSPCLYLLGAVITGC